VNPPPAPDGAAQSPGRPAAPPAELAVLDLGVLRDMGIVPGSGPGSMPSEIIALFLREERPRVERLAGFAAERKVQDLAQAAHNVAGSCAILGARQVQAAAISLELATRALDWPAVAVRLAELLAGWVRLEAALVPYRKA
jgi:HPt (histidine-containing phosphotransfer) domain-containing protein